MTYVLAGIGYLLALGLVAAAILWVLDRIRYRKPTPAEEARRRAARHTALLNTDWAALKQGWGVPAPASLRRLYGDRDLVTSDELTFSTPPGTESPREWDLLHFEPLEADPIELDWTGAPRNSVRFALSLFGDPYYVVLGTYPDGDGPVRIYYHDGGETEQVAPSLAEFLSWPRRPLGRSAA